MKPVEPIMTWHDLLGEKRESMTDVERRARWEEWKKVTTAVGDKHIVDYWAKDNVEETCSGCVHRDKDWCKLAGLPCNINPILTMKAGIIGMACMGAGKELAPVQQSLF